MSLSEIKAYSSSSLDDEGFNHLMLNIRQFLKNEMPDTNEEHNIQISQHIESFRALLSKKTFIDFIESEKAPESLKNSSDIKSMTEEFKKEHLEFSASLESFLQKISDSIDVSFKNELEIPEVIQLAIKEDNTDIRELKKKYKIK